MKSNTSNQKKRPKSSASTTTRSDEWQGETKSIIYARMLVDIYSTYPPSSEEEIMEYRKRKRSVMHEYLVVLKKVTAKIRSSYLKVDFPKAKSFRITGRGSTSKEKDYGTSWTLHTKENSKKLWLPTKIDCVVSDLNSSSTSSKAKAMLKSWFSVTACHPLNRNLPMTYSPSSLSLVPECTDLGNTKSKCKKTKVYFRGTFKQKMKQMIGTYRYFYNQGIVYLNSLERGYYIPTEEMQKKPDYIYYEGQYHKVETGGRYCYGVLPKFNADGLYLSQTNFQAIRNYLKERIPDWFVGMPVHLIDQASRECASNFSSIIQRRRCDRKKFSMRFKSKRNSTTETINMAVGMLTAKGTICPKIFKGYDSYIYCREPMNFKANKKEFQITYDRNTHEYYISLSVPKKYTKNNSLESSRWCSIDPGEKIFATVYNPFDREVLFVGNNERKNFNDTTIDKLQSSISRRKTNGKLKALQRARNRDRNRRTELHHKLANYLCSNFKHIVIPEYGVKGMKVHSTVNRSMRNLGFYQFLTFLKHKCSERNVKLYVVNESYTTRACSSCGCLNKPNDREYSCVSCKTEIHRDINGAVNIGLKHLR